MCIRDRFQVRNQIANVPGASVPQPFGGRYRQIQIYVDPLKLEAHNMSLMDVVTAVNQSNLILPAGDVRIGTKDFNIYANSQVPTPEQINSMPVSYTHLDVYKRQIYRVAPAPESSLMPDKSPAPS